MNISLKKGARERKCSFLVAVLALCASSMGLVACGGDGIDGSTSTDSASTEYSIDVLAGGEGVALSVQVSSEMADHYEQISGHEVDARAIEGLVAGAVQRRVDEGSTKVAAGVSAAKHISLDLVDAAAGAGVQLGAPGQDNAGGCVVYVGTTVTIDIDCDCRYREYNDVFYNACNGTYTYVYLYSTVSCSHSNPYQEICP